MDPILLSLGRELGKFQKHDQPVVETYYLIFIYKKSLPEYVYFIGFRKTGRKGGKRNFNQLLLICTLTGN